MSPEEGFPFEYKEMLGLSHVMTPEQITKHSNRHLLVEGEMDDEQVEWVRAEE